jgi:phage FluMu protein Com
MGTVFQVQIRCTTCNRRLADVVNEIEIGQAIVELKCPRCANSHLEILCPLDSKVLIRRGEGAAVNSTCPPVSEPSESSRT